MSTSEGGGSTRDIKAEGVIEEDPPNDQNWMRRSFWVTALEAARARSTWVRVQRFYTQKTAAQIASDLRSAHRRRSSGIRVKGVVEGEKWDARWGVSPEGPPGHFAIWVRYIGRVDD